MTGENLNKATTVSLLMHIAFIALIFLASTFKPSVIPKIYTVSIITPAAPAVSASPTASKAKAKPAYKKKTIDTKAMAQRKKAFRERRYIKDKIVNLKKQQSEQKHKLNSLERIRQRIESENRLERIRDRAITTGHATDRQGKAVRKGVVLNEYYAKIIDQIYDEWIFPDMKVQDMSCTIAITIMRDGRVIFNRFERFSGSELFDRSAMRAIYRASPVAPPPFGKKLELGVNFIPNEKK